ncbi:hypothetical protein B9T33_05440 [Acinetobacter sp. ANC 5054]|uniref:hypothetical protein n=1 Tax=Acinetobacter sp. ANC 5054 TaxID=1977877 RepID=UPI000A350164|nr:hypothetical protein [Acinetobacter sp. ANC 5054]OTG81969.1 hypothetical protein B9T33_05440 [Acinetobacter sp. ANC 5054]
MKISENVIDFSKLSTEKKHDFFQQLWDFDQKIFPSSRIEQLYEYLHDPDAVAIPVVQFFHRDKLIGQNIIRILKLNHKNRPILIFNSRAGVLPEYRSHNLTLNSAIKVAMQFQIRFPAIPMWFVATVTQPKVYTLFASRSVKFYPRYDAEMPEEYMDILKSMRVRHHDVQQRTENIFVHLCDLPKVTPEQLVQLRNKSDVHIQYFMQHVPDYFDGMGMMCICKLNVSTIFEASMNIAMGRAV